MSETCSVNTAPWPCPNDKPLKQPGSEEARRRSAELGVGCRAAAASRVDLSRLSYLLQLMATAMCPRCFGSQRTHQTTNEGVGGWGWGGLGDRPSQRTSLVFSARVTITP